jgi:septin family protein
MEEELRRLLTSPQIRRFSARANVLPVLTHADALTTDELRAARGAVVRDLATVFGRDPLGKWGVLSVMPADSDVEVEIDPDVSMEDDEEDEEGEGGETSLERPAKHTPFAVFAPEPGRSTRIFPWGRADAADAAHSDLPAIREALISAAQWLRTSTRRSC